MAYHIVATAAALTGLALTVGLCLLPSPQSEVDRGIIINGLVASLTIANLGAATFAVEFSHRPSAASSVVFGTYAAFVVALSIVTYFCGHRIGLVGCDYAVGPFLALASESQALGAIVGSYVLRVGSIGYDRTVKPISLAEAALLVAFFSLRLAIARSHPSAEEWYFERDMVLIALGAGLGTAIMGLIVIWFSSKIMSRTRLWLIAAAVFVDYAFACWIPDWISSFGAVVSDCCRWTMFACLVFGVAIGAGENVFQSSDSAGTPPPPDQKDNCA